MPLEGVDVGGPEAAERSEPRVELHQRLRPNPVKTPLRINPRLDETRLAQHPQVLGNRRLRQSQALFDVAHGSLGGREQAQDGAAVRFGDDGEC
ncbi:MAG TPA: hypothetical protein VLK83_04980 [Rhodanobacteraceae bacterium]|nr:hypothetical protein [Rhodanobacteraceae bacterium]